MAALNLIPVAICIRKTLYRAGRCQVNSLGARKPTDLLERFNIPNERARLIARFRGLFGSSASLPINLINSVDFMGFSVTKLSGRNGLRVMIVLFIALTMHRGCKKHIFYYFTH